MTKATIFYDAPHELEWFKSLNPRLRNIESKKILDRGKNKPPIVNELIIYDRPDIIFLLDERPVLVLEKTEEVPSGHNVGQRIGRLARAVEMGIPIIKFFPFLAKKHGKFASLCYVRPNIFLAFKKMREFHNVPVMALNWICDSNGELRRNGTENTEIKKLITSWINNGFSFTDLPNVENIEKNMQKEYNIRVASNTQYRKLAPSISICKTSDFSAALKSSKDLPVVKLILSRKETFVYRMDMTPEKCRREDPYTGNQFIYDYSYCRTGINISDRDKNLVLSFPLITKKRWFEANPEDLGRKSFLWYVLADFILFKDGIAIRGVDYDKPLKEPEIYMLAKEVLIKNGWRIIGGEPPDGTDHIPRIEVHDPNNLKKGSKGSKKIDLIAFKNEKILLLELKTLFDKIDIDKLDSIVSKEVWLAALLDAIKTKTNFNTSKYKKENIIKSIGLSCYHDFPDDYILLVFSRKEYRLYIGKKSKIDMEKFRL